MGGNLRIYIWSEDGKLTVLWALRFVIPPACRRLGQRPCPASAPISLFTDDLPAFHQFQVPVHRVRIPHGGLQVFIDGPAGAGGVS